MSPALFTLCAALTLASAVGVVANKNVVNAAMCFLLGLVGVAGLFVQLDAYLLAFLLLLVYAGAVVVLFLFIVMLLGPQGRAAWRLTPGAVVGGLVAGALLLAGWGSLLVHGRLDPPPPDGAPWVGAALKPYAYQLFTTYLLPVQVMGFLLLVAMLGVIVLSRKADGTEKAP